MANEKYKLIHKRSNQLVSGQPKAPASGILEKGELAINYNNTDPCLFIIKEDGTIAKFSSSQVITDFVTGITATKQDTLVSGTNIKTINGNSILGNGNLSLAADMFAEITYSALKALRDGEELVPGQQYRITDYQTTVSGNSYTVGNHAFDIIVTADDKNTLNEVARAIQHEGDTYFSNSNLAAWELKYCLDNDTDRFAWANTSSGKGVIYYMKDEFNNECPYDFKNIQFYRKWNSSKSLWCNNGTASDGVAAYTFSSTGSSSTTSFTDYSLSINNSVYSNVIKEYISLTKQTLNNICFFGISCNSNTFGNNCSFNTFGGSCRSNTFGTNCYNNTFGDYCYYNTFGDYCQYNTFGNKCFGNIFGNECYNNTFGTNCYNNTFGNDCHHNTFASNSTGTVGNYFYRNTLENGVQYCILYNTSTASSSILVKNYHIKSSVVGKSSSRKLIEATRDLAYDTTVALNSSGELKIYCEADLIA